MRFAMVKARGAWLYTEDLKGRTDELFPGWAVGVTKKRREAGKSAYVGVVTHYGYEGYAEEQALHETSAAELLERDCGTDTYVVRRAFADILSEPKVQGRILLTLGRGSFVRLLQKRENGFALVETYDGVRGFLAGAALRRRLDQDGYLYRDNPETYFLRQHLPEQMTAEAFRQSVTAHATSYLGSQYRWGGKSAEGLDCSGLTFMSYQMSGILIYRDAALREAYPVQRIDRTRMRKGDLLYFPGHIALYLGQGRYIHCTGQKDSLGCVINSLCEGDSTYRKDLAENLLAIGSIF